MLEERTPTALLAVALAVATIVACSGEVSPGSTPGEGVYIPEHWQTTRTVDGHFQHVLREKLACSKCHELTESEIGPVTPSRCASCHAEQAKLKHATQQAQDRFGSDATSDCTQCHAFTAQLPKSAGAGPVVPHAAGDCSRCHASDQGDTPKVEVHHTQPCLSCHQPHAQATPSSAPCNECHMDITTSHASQGRQVLEVCTTCHEHQHAPASDARNGCASCHSEQQPLVADTAVFPEGHTECVGCHRPHEFGKQQAVACQNCHESVHVLGGRRIQAHQVCTNCHDPHAVRQASASGCSGCHSEIRPNHPKHGAAGTCTGCHDPHPSAAQTTAKVRQCSSCHQEAAHDTDRHQGVACRACHTPHDFMLADKGVAVCSQCHQGNTVRATSLAGHSNCADCHRGLPHRPAALQVACVTCHSQQQGQATAGHRECQNCHEPHAGSIEKQCQSCHRQEHSTAPKGHQACGDCHQPHSGSPAGAACANCHAEAAQTPHGQLSSSCNDCHRAHGPEGVGRPPSCGSCHQSATLPGLHENLQHSDCKDCHAAHGTPQQARQRCLSCHTKQQDHFPNAPECVSCHLFVVSRK